jgi:hypothetical protein
VPKAQVRKYIFDAPKLMPDIIMHLHITKSRGARLVWWFTPSQNGDNVSRKSCNISRMFVFAQEFSPIVINISLIALILGEIILLAIIIFLVIKNRRLNKKLSVFFSGKEARDLEKVLMEQLNEVKELDREIQELFEIGNRLRELGMKSLHKTSVLRFNPFKEVGGNQSFSVALLDGKNSGFVLSSLHTREGTRVYAKPVIAGQAGSFPLTEEEKSTITQAIQGKLSAV